MQLKNITLSQEGMIEGYASLFDLQDETGDIVERGAFNASIMNKGVQGIKMLWQHDPKEPIGKWLHLMEDGRGLKVMGQINIDTQRGREVRALLLSGAIDGLSIGFKAVKSRKTPRAIQRYLTEIDLWEISVVTFPALKGARVNSVKSL
jgi:HK97 family phage prohead protease